MTFQFRLAPLLRLRRSVERQERARLERTGQHLAAVRKEMENIEAAALPEREALQRKLRRGAPGSDVLRVALADKLRQERLDALTGQGEQAQARLDAQRAVYRDACRDSQVLERLRLRRAEEFRRHQSRRHQAELDDLFRHRHIQVVS